MKMRMSFVSLFLLLSFVGEMVKGYENCGFPAIYNFGDSNSDTGAMSAPSPNGNTYFGKPASRVSDGRLIIDFMAEKLGLPFLQAYEGSIGPNFRHGANFAIGGSAITPQDETNSPYGATPTYLAAQAAEFANFKAKTSELYNQVTSPDEKANLPDPNEFYKALYTIDIGHNDLTTGFSKTPEQLRASIPDILDHFSEAVKRLYDSGARVIWIHNTGPIGCLPSARFYFSGETDQYGCLKYQNDIACDFNKQLKDRVYQWRTQFKDAALVYVDLYTAKYQLISDAKNQGFVDPLQICCGYHKDQVHVMCGDKQNINGNEIFGSSCGNPGNYISWDGVHFSDAANQWIANRIISGGLSDPPVSLAQACQKS